MRRHLHLCRPLWQAEPPGFLYFSVHSFRNLRVFGHYEPARRRTASGNMEVSFHLTHYVLSKAKRRRHASPECDLPAKYKIL